MIDKLRNNPLLTALLVVAIYGISFFIPVILNGIPPDAKGIAGITSAIKLLPGEAITAVIVAIIITILGWWKQVGFTPLHKGSIKFFVPILLLTAIIFWLTYMGDTSGKWFMGFESPTQMLKLLAAILLIGFVEESIFRGIFLYALGTKYRPLLAIIISAVVFGSFHFVNILAGADPYGTIFQVTHAASMGFLYGSLRLISGAIWPLMILHGFWDMSLFVLQTTTQHLAPPPNEHISLLAGLSISIPALLYGIFVYWRLSKRLDGAK